MDVCVTVLFKKTGGGGNRIMVKKWFTFQHSVPSDIGSKAYCMTAIEGISSIKNMQVGTCKGSPIVIPGQNFILIAKRKVERCMLIRNDRIVDNGILAGK